MTDTFQCPQCGRRTPRGPDAPVLPSLCPACATAFHAKDREVGISRIHRNLPLIREPSPYGSESTDPMEGLDLLAPAGHDSTDRSESALMFGLGSMVFALCFAPIGAAFGVMAWRIGIRELRAIAGATGCGSRRARARMGVICGMIGLTFSLAAGIVGFIILGLGGQR